MASPGSSPRAVSPPQLDVPDATTTPIITSPSGAAAASPSPRFPASPLEAGTPVVSPPLHPVMGAVSPGTSGAGDQIASPSGVGDAALDERDVAISMSVPASPRRYTEDGMPIPVHLKDPDAPDSAEDEELSVAEAKEWAKRQRVLKYREAKWKEDEFGSQVSNIDGLDLDTLEGQNYPLCIGRRKLGILGVGTALYFKDLKFFQAICMIMFLCHGVGLYENWIAAENANLYLRTTIANRDQGIVTLYHLVGDVVSVLFFLAAVYLFQFRMGVNVRSINRKSITAGDYAVMVSGMGRRFDDANALWQHFQSKWGEVAAMELAKDNTRLMATRWTRVKLENQLAHHRAWEKRNGKHCFCISYVGSAERKLEKNQRRIDKLVVAKYRTSYAFVTLQQTSTRRDILRAYNPGSLLVRLARRFCCLCVGNHLRFQGKRLRVRPAPEPSDIKWENLHYGRFERNIRRAIVLAVSFVIVVTNFILLQLVKTWFASQAELAAVTSILSSLVVIIANNILRRALFAFGHFVKPASHTEYEQGVMFNVFVAELLNTAGPIIATYPLASTEAWFSRAGTTLLIVMTADALSSLRKLLNPLRVLVRAVKRRGAITQQELNQVYLGPEFHLSEKYALFLKTIYLAVMFGAGLPHVYLIAAANMLITYWSEKTLLLRRYRRPPMLKERLAHMTLIILPYAMVGHLYGLYKFYLAPKDEADQFFIPGVSLQLFILFFLAAALFFAGLQSFVWRLTRRKKIDMGGRRRDDKPYNKVAGIAKYLSPANEAAHQRRGSKRLSRATSPVSPDAKSPPSRRASARMSTAVASPRSPQLLAVPEGRDME